MFLDLSPRLTSEATDRLTPVPRQADIVNLAVQRSSWVALVAGDYRTAAAHLHDALLRGRPATLDELHGLAGSERVYELHIENIPMNVTISVLTADLLLLSPPRSPPPVVDARSLAARITVDSALPMQGSRVRQ